MYCMARIPILEHDAKKTISYYLGLKYQGLHINIKNPFPKNPFPKNTKLVVKVDQIIGNRANQGLIKLNLTYNKALDWIKSVHQKHHYQYFLIEPFIPHQKPHYLSLNRQRDGIHLIFHPQGGINIENRLGTALQITLPYPLKITSSALSPLKNYLNSSNLNFLQKLITAFDQLDFAFLELNPITFHPLSFIDTVAEVDSNAHFFHQKDWFITTFPQPVNHHTTPQEKLVQRLNQQTPASLKLTVLNPKGQIWMLLSGGGASLVLADEVADLGWGPKLANYGEYSGSPSTEDTYLYTQQILSLLLDSLQTTRQKQALIIAGGVANFTDVYKTFKGIVMAIDQFKNQLATPQFKVFIRRGGPNQEKGLKFIKSFLNQNHIQNIVVNDQYPLTYPVKQAIKWLST